MLVIKLLYIHGPRCYNKFYKELQLWSLLQFSCKAFAIAKVYCINTVSRCLSTSRVFLPGNTHNARFRPAQRSPVVGLCIFPYRIQKHEAVIKSFSIPFIDVFFLLYMLIQMPKLAPDDTRNDTTHPIVISQFFTVIPGCTLPGL